MGALPIIGCGLVMMIISFLLKVFYANDFRKAIKIAWIAYWCIAGTAVLLYANILALSIYFVMIKSLL